MASTVIIKRGAEAVLQRTTWHGRKAVEKHRLPKEYRSQQLDGSLRKSRLRMEIRLMTEARKIGVTVPLIFDVDIRNNRIVMEYIEGPTIKDALQQRIVNPIEIAQEIGRIVARLHSNDIMHGDLTTSNMILKNSFIYLIDFSLGEKTSSFENKGVDLHLLKEALTSAHSDMPKLFKQVITGYKEVYADADSILMKVEDIESRGRYT